jgi:membrane protein DedA with SNARE-associated domain
MTLVMQETTRLSHHRRDSGTYRTASALRQSIAMTANTTPQQDASGTSRPTRDEAIGHALKEWEKGEKELAKEQMKALRLWEGKPKAQDKILLGLMIGLPLLLTLTIPLRPLLLADHPVLLAAITGSYAAIGAGGAFAGVGQGALWVIVLAGVLGKVKLNWFFWWLGHRWGDRIIRFMAPTDRAQRFADRLKAMNPWVLRVLVVFAYLPGVPSQLICVLAGTSGMRLRVYMLMDILGALMVTWTVAYVGYASGQTGVDVVLLIDRYALWIMVALIFVVAMYPVFLTSRDQKARRAAVVKEAGEAYDAETERLAAGSAGASPEAGPSGDQTPQHDPDPATTAPTSKNSEE